MRSAFIFLILFSITFINCSSQVKNQTQKKPIDQVMKDNQQMLLSVNGVQGFYQGVTDDGVDYIIVMVDTLTKEIMSKLPDSLEGYPVKLEETGEIKPLDSGADKSSP